MSIVLYLIYYLPQIIPSLKILQYRITITTISNFSGVLKSFKSSASNNGLLNKIIHEKTILTVIRIKKSI
jgi:hypothetical protein